MLQVKDIMDPNVILIGQEATMRETFVLMQKHDAEIFVVVDSKARFKGVITVRDLLASCYPEFLVIHKKPERITPVQDRLRLSRDMTVRNLMQDDYGFASPYDPVMKIGSIMIDRKLTIAPVVDSEHHVVGLISQRMIFEELIKKSLEQKNTRTPSGDGENLQRIEGFYQRTEAPSDGGKYPEQRLFHRYEVSLEADYELADSGDVPIGFYDGKGAVISDLNSSGAKIISNEQLQPGQVLNLRCFFDETNGFVECLCRVIHTRALSEKRFELGMLFLSVTTADRQKIDRYIQSVSQDPLLKHFQ